MKNVIILLVVVTALLFSCSKDQLKESGNGNGASKSCVKAIEGSFVAVDGNITVKSADLAVVTREWEMYAVNSPWYAPTAYALVKGTEFITGSAAQIWWANPANNPVSFPVGTSVYSNLTPDENLRTVEKGINADGKVVFLGILDFKPSAASFPLTVNGFRLGDKLNINTKALTDLPGSNNITITVKTTLAEVDMVNTIVKTPLSTVWNTPTGTQMHWSDIVYKATEPVNEVTVPPTNGFFEVYDLLNKKAFGNVIITITEVNNGGSVIVKTIPAADPGKYLNVTLSTNKVGWFDSGTINITDSDITVTAVDVPVN